MRALWSGSISFGLVNIPVKLYGASEERGLSFRMLDRRTLAPIQHRRAGKDGEEVPAEHIVKGYAVGKGKYVIMEEEDFRRAAAKKSGRIDIVAFADESEIDRRLYDKPYILEPDEKAGKAYALLREALRKSGKVGIARFVMHDRERIGALKAEGKALFLEQLRYQDELRDPGELDLPVRSEPAKKELDLALSLIEHLSGHFDPSEYEDTYSDALKKVIRAKEKGALEAPGPERGKPVPTEIEDMLEVLRQSLLIDMHRVSSRPP